MPKLFLEVVALVLTDTFRTDVDEPGPFQANRVDFAFIGRGVVGYASDRQHFGRRSHVQLTITDQQESFCTMSDENAYDEGCRYLGDVDCGKKV